LVVRSWLQINGSKIARALLREQLADGSKPDTLVEAAAEEARDFPCVR
jgi:hypothetical protein